MKQKDLHYTECGRLHAKYGMVGVSCSGSICVYGLAEKLMPCCCQKNLLIPASGLQAAGFTLATRDFWTRRAT